MECHWENFVNLYLEKIVHWSIVEILEKYHQYLRKNEVLKY